MKKRIFKKTLIVLAVFSILFSLVSCFANNKTIDDIPPLFIPQPGNVLPAVEYNIQIEPRDTEEYATIYQFTIAEESQESIDSLAQIFNLFDIEETETIDTRQLLISGEKLLDYDMSTGKWTYVDGSYDKFSPAELPSDDEAVSIAEAFLDANNLNHERFTIAKSVVQYTGDELGDDYNPYCKAVYFYPTVDGLNILGVSRIVVQIGNLGEIIGVMKLYKDFEPCGQIEIVPPALLYSGVIDGTFSSSISPEAISADISDVQLAYWEDAGSLEEQPYLQPVWVFTGTSIQQDGTTSSFDIIAPAAQSYYTQ